MPHPLSDRRTWVFDLDNTLYPAGCNLFAEIDQRMTAFVARTLDLTPRNARILQKRYYAEYGTTLSGLMQVHGLEPEAFLADVHDIDLSPLPVMPKLRTAIETLPGRKFIFTNGARIHAERVTGALGLGDVFDGLFSIEDAQYTPKPRQDAFDRFIDHYDVRPANAVFFEDLTRNLAPAHAMGFATVLVHSDQDWSHEPKAARPAKFGDDQPAHVDYVTSDLTGFLAALISAD